MNKINEVTNKIHAFKSPKVILVHKHEMAKFLYTSALVFFITYIHSTLRAIKDVMIMEQLSTEAISAVKVWAVLPVSLILMFVYMKLSDRFTRSQLFHIMNFAFISYFLIFGFLIYPNRQTLSIAINIDFINKLPAFKYLFQIIENWHLALFYVFSDCWATIMLSISFWQIANHTTTIEESKRFYFLFGFVAQLGLLLSSLLARISINTKAEAKEWIGALHTSTVIIVIAGFSLSLCLIALKKTVGSQSFDLRSNHFKTKINMKESFKYILSSKPIRMMASLLFCYNVATSLVEDVWKKCVENAAHQNPNTMHSVILDTGVYGAIISLILAALGIYLLRIWSWKTIALITPIVSLVTGAAFFIVIKIFGPNYAVLLYGMQINFVVWFGGMNSIFSRATKHTLLDATKEMVYIPLDDDLQTKGKAAVETVGMGLGKGAGALIEQILLISMPTLSLITLAPHFSIIFLAVSIWWIYSTVGLSNWLNKTGLIK